jgi:hypothetical protein
MIDQTTDFIIVGVVIVFLFWIIYRISKSPGSYGTSTINDDEKSPSRRNWDEKEREADRQRTGVGNTVSNVKSCDKDSYGRPRGGYVENFSKGKTSFHKPK